MLAKPKKQIVYVNEKKINNAKSEVVVKTVKLEQSP